MIDFHLHLVHGESSVEHIIAHMDYHNVGKAVVLPLEDLKSGPTFETEKVLEGAKKYPGRIIPFCHVDPRSGKPLERIRVYVEQGCCGFGEHKVRGMDVDEPIMREIYGLCGELGLPVLLHIQYDLYNTNLPALEDMLKMYPDTVFIGHGQAWWANVSGDEPTDSAYPKGKVQPGGFSDRLMTEYPNIYGDLSAGSGLNALTRDKEFAEGFVARHRKRLLWATDCPCKDGKGKDFPEGCYVVKSLPVLRELAPNEETFEDIVHNNAVELLGL